MTGLRSYLLCRCAGCEWDCFELDRGRGGPQHCPARGGCKLAVGGCAVHGAARCPVHGPLAVSAERGVACAFLGVQRAVVLDLVGLRATPVHSHLVAAVPAPPSLLWAGTHAIGSMLHKLSHTATVCARPRALCRRAGQGMTFSVCTAGGWTQWMMMRLVRMLTALVWRRAESERECEILTSSSHPLAG